MRRTTFALVLVLGGCGYVADPQPPALHIPQTITDLRVIQRGDKIVLDFTVPSLTTDGLPVQEVTAVDARGDATGDPDAETARRLPAPQLKPGAVRIETPAGDWAGREITFAVRVAGRRGRFSAWSNRVVRQIVPPLGIPANLQATDVAEGVRLQWTPVDDRPGLTWRIYRRLADQNDQQELAPVGVAGKPEFIDSSTVYGKRYEYAVKAIIPTGSAEAESEMSSTVSISPVDHFAPGVPTGLTALAGTDSIELAWDPRPEPDLLGYRLYRAAGDGEFSPVGELIETPAYSDRKIESGKLYRYTVTSVDRLNNESARSQSVEIAAP